MCNQLSHIETGVIKIIYSDRIIHFTQNVLYVINLICASLDSSLLFKPVSLYPCP